MPAIADAALNNVLMIRNPLTINTFKITILMNTSIISSNVIFSLKFPTALKNPIIINRSILITPIANAQGYNSVCTYSHVSTENPCGVVVIIPVHTVMTIFHIALEI